MKKVIVQDTDQDLLDTLVMILEEAGYRVMAFQRYADILPAIATHHPDALLLDHRLSGEKSTALCRQVKASFPCLPVIALSCNMDIAESYALSGFDDYLSKPFDIAALADMISRHIEGCP